MKVKYIVYSALVIGFAALVIYRISEGKEQRGGGAPGNRSGAAATMRVNGVVMQPTSFANSLSITGSIEANEQVQVRSEVSGVVRGISFKEGSNVRKGQVLLKIDDTELKAQLSQALTRQGLAGENEKRAKLLLAKEAISRAEYDVALADLKSLAAQTDLIRAQLAKTSVIAPFSGRVGLRNISEGAYISPETIVANLVNLNPVKITFSIPEKYSNQVATNTNIKFTVAGSAKEYAARVYAIEPGIDAATRTLQLRARAENPSGSLLPGSFASVKLPLTVIKDALLLPSQAIVPVQDGKKVFVVENSQAKEVMVETSSRTENNVLVTSGLKAGDTVLTTGIMSLKDGAPVTVSIK